MIDGNFPLAWHLHYNFKHKFKGEDKVLLFKGHWDKTTIANISVTIKFTLPFLNMWAGYPKYSIQLIAAK